MWELDAAREHGYKIFGPTVKSAQLEINREAGMKAMQAVGIELPPYEMFNSLEDAEAFARKQQDGYVFKTMGDEDDKSLSFVASDPAEMVQWIRHKIDMGMKLKGPCMLQEKIDMLCDYGAAGWMGPEGFIPGAFEISFEHKKLMDGEVGPATGEQGTLIAMVDSDRAVEECLKPMEPILRTLGHCGDFAIGLGIDSKGNPYPFEFSARCGWPDFFIRTAVNKGDPAQFMRDWLDGKDTLKVDKRPAIGVVLAQPPYPQPASDLTKVIGNPVSGLDEVWDDIHLCQVMLGNGAVMKDGKVSEGPLYQTTGTYVAVATGLGSTIEKARKAVYEVVDTVKFPNKMFRRDIGQKVQKVLPDLHKFGYSLDLKE
jgi:phosphoribosylamine--glycine ligase